MTEYTLSLSDLILCICITVLAGGILTVFDSNKSLIEMRLNYLPRWHRRVLLGAHTAG